MTDEVGKTRLREGLLRALSHVYGDVLRRQGRTTTPFVRWSKVTGRLHEFSWLGGVERREVLLSDKGSLDVPHSSPLFAAVQKMRATAVLNPYEREILYGYPYVIGRRDSDSIRGPLLTVPVRIEERGDGFVVKRADDVVHVNVLPLGADGDVDLHELKLRRVIEASPAIPLERAGLTGLVAAVSREFPSVDCGHAALDGRLDPPPAEPSGPSSLRVVDQAALFIAPKTSYFLVSDLEFIGENGAGEGGSALEPLLAGPGSDAQVELDEEEVAGARVFFPFPSNRSQRRVAQLVDDDTTTVVKVEGPPGTGKSLTIANVACHLAASGRTVLISSQKDKALQVVDEKLRELDLAELPMTLLHRDCESKKDLLRRLERIRKERSEDEVRAAFEGISTRFGVEVDAQVADAREFAATMAWEDALERAHRSVAESRGLARLMRRVGYRRTRGKMSSKARRTTDIIAEAVGKRRSELQGMAVEALEVGRELAISEATREERAHLRELAAVLKRDQTRFKNFSLFDRLKAHPERAAMLLKMLPVWIMTPDDVARLFPCTPGLFDVVIVDEASQADLPSMTPIAYRGKKLVILGDSKQMQPRRFAFMSQNVTRQAWQRWGMDEFDEEHWLHPAEQSLLTLAAVRTEEEALLDEHFRSLPPIIQFSNERWYGAQLRIMTDESQKRFGTPGQPVMQLHHVPNGTISNGSQENEVEATAVVDFLKQLVRDPDYAGASIGVMCLFEEQVALVQDLVATQVPAEEWEDHQIVVINPDGFQGDERDVVVYSLSYDANLMPQSAISARMSDQAHVQGMLNVAFTRARDEIHVFHSAPFDAFTFAEGRPSALSDWLQQCARVQAADPASRRSSRLGKVDSQFEADVADALRQQGLRVLHQYPACGFNVDLLAEREEDGVRILVECDGERFHLDEHGRLRIEDIERQAILERAGWRVLRIPYRKWLADPDTEVARVSAALDQLASDVGDDGEDLSVSGDADEGEGVGGADRERAGEAKESGALRHAEAPTHRLVPASTAEGATGPREWVNRDQAILIDALNAGHCIEDDVFRYARDQLGLQRLTQKLRARLRSSMTDLSRRGLIAIEDGEYFVLPKGRSATLLLRSFGTAHMGRQRRGRWR